jgi:hypothetical protein
MAGSAAVKSGRGGRALLAGILTCGRCGRRLAVVYTGLPPGRPVYRCDRPNLMLGLPRCLGFGGPRVDAAIAGEILRAVAPMAVEAALEAERMQVESQAERQRIVELDLRQARYEASLAERRYAACDPDNRLIAAQLEKSWETALRRVEACEARLDAMRAPGSRRRRAGLHGAGRRSRRRMERAWRHDARPAAAAAGVDHRHHRRRRRGGARGHPDHPLVGRPALAAAGQKAQDGRARLPDTRGGVPGRDPPCRPR